MAGFDRQDTTQKVMAIIAEKLAVQPNTIDGHVTLQDVGADSLDMVEIVMKLEEQFNIEINDEKAEELHTVNDVIDYVHSLRTK